MITILSGGTGSVKLVRGLSAVTKDFVVVCNIGDNIWLHGLYICPDIDTIVYGLANMLDIERGWGVSHDSFEFIRQMELLGEESWFRIGDRDLATHLVRTRMLKEGKSLIDVTQWMCNKYGISAKVIPVTEQYTETKVVTEEGDMHLQEFWVKHNARMQVKDIIYSGANKAKPSVEALDAIRSSSMIIIAPANPVTSIGPMLAIRGVKEALEKARNKCVAISPIIGNKPISGPAAKYMQALGIEVSPYGVASFYSDIISRIIIDSSDQQYARKIEALGINVNHTNIMMNDMKDESRLASYLLGMQKSVRY
ncbi:MAG: 2-phospho-L-lactate transferase [Nitrososphaerales archaeon]